MNNKKIALSIGSISALVAPIASVVSCGFDFGENYVRSGGKVVLITDTGSVADKSFNQAAWDGTQSFGNGNDTTFSYIIPSELNQQHFWKAYEEALDNGADTLVLPGFHHASFADGKIGTFDPSKPGFEGKYPTKNFIGIDIPDLDPNNKVYALNFKTSQSGFQAAIYAGIYMNTLDENGNSIIEGNTIKFAGYGGLRIGSVTPFLDGFLQGANWFNNNKTNLNWKPFEGVFASGSEPSDSDFTGGFAPGMATELSNQYISSGAQIVVSVAGPQTADTIGAIQENGKVGKAFVIGPDTDQSLVYNDKIVLGSMMKGIQASTEDTLEKIYSKNGKHFGADGGDTEYYYTNNTADRIFTGFLPSKSLLGTAKDNDIKSNPLYIKAINDLLKTETSALTKIYDSGHKGGKDLTQIKSDTNYTLTGGFYGNY